MIKIRMMSLMRIKNIIITQKTSIMIKIIKINLYKDSSLLNKNISLLNKNKSTIKINC